MEKVNKINFRLLEMMGKSINVENHKQAQKFAREEYKKQVSLEENRIKLSPSNRILLIKETFGDILYLQVVKNDSALLEILKNRNHYDCIGELVLDGDKNWVIKKI